MIRYKADADILDMLKTAGFSTYRIAKENVFGQSTLQKFRIGKLPSWNELDKLCSILNCQPFDLIEYIHDDKAPGH